MDSAYISIHLHRFSLFPVSNNIFLPVIIIQLVLFVGNCASGECFSVVAKAFHASKRLADFVASVILLCFKRRTCFAYSGRAWKLHVKISADKELGTKRPILWWTEYEREYWLMFANEHRIEIHMQKYAKRFNACCILHSSETINGFIHVKIVTNLYNLIVSRRHMANHI